MIAMGYWSLLDTLNGLYYNGVLATGRGADQWMTTATDAQMALSPKCPVLFKKLVPAMLTDVRTVRPY